MKKIALLINRGVKIIEIILAFFVAAAVVIFLATNFVNIMQFDWSQKEFFYEFIYRILLATIGLELARMLVTHNFMSILELLAFVVARKMLKPDIEALEILMGTLSFIILLSAYKYLIVPLKQIGSSKNPEINN